MTHISVGQRRFFGRRRRGATVVLFAVMLVVVISFIALSVDLGYVCSVKGDLQVAADAAALAGAGVILEGKDVARETAHRYAIQNLNNGGVSVGEKNQIDIEIGHWNATARRFTPGGRPQDAVEVIATSQDAPLFFGRAVGRDLFVSRARAVAAYRPRDIILVLDVSGSMNEASNGIRKIDELRQAVTAFLGYVREANSRDRVGFSYYSSTASLGTTLSYNLDMVESQLLAKLVPRGATNIADGMAIAIEELRAKQRAQASPLIVLLTDGAANVIQPENTWDVPEAKRRVIVQAELAKTAGYPIFTMALDSFSSEVDVELMKQVAEITGSESYHIVAGAVGTSGSRELLEAFRRVALNRPLRLVE